VIVSSRIIQVSPQGDDRKWITELHVDHVGVQHRVEYLADSDTDIDSALAVRAPQIDQQCREQELQRLEQMVLDGIPIMPDHPPVYNNVQDVYAYLFNKFIQETDPVVLLKAANFTDLFTDAELLSYGLTDAQIQRIRTEAEKVQQAAAILATFQPLGGN
jgi:hypothetical protein